MREISSKNNSIVKLCRQLSLKKYRERFSKYLIEGDNILNEALKNHARIDAILISRGCEKKLEKLLDPPDKILLETKTFVLGKELFDSMCQTETSQGILAIVSKKDYSIEKLKESKSGNVVVLDRLQDPGNIGTIIRTADAAGYGAVICIKGTGDVFSPKVVRAATGSLFRMPVVFMDSPKELVEFTGAAGKKLVSTCLDTDHFYYEEDLKNNIALVIGNEGNGISQDLIDSSDIKIKIPMEGSIESLNASVAAGILMYESMRKERG